MMAKKLNHWQAWWSLYLSWFDFALHHQPECTMGKSDALSWQADHGTGAEDNRDVILLKPELFAVRALEGITAEGKEQDILRDICRGTQDGDHETLVAHAAQELGRATGKSLHSSEWRSKEGLLMFQD